MMSSPHTPPHRDGRRGSPIRQKLFTRVEHFSVHQFDRFSTASLVTRTTNDTTQVQQVLIDADVVITAPMMAIGGVILAVAGRSWRGC